MNRPKCAYSIPAPELRRIDFEHVICPRCGEQNQSGPYTKISLHDSLSGAANGARRVLMTPHRESGSSTQRKRSGWSAVSSRQAASARALAKSSVTSKGNPFCGAPTGNQASSTFATACSAASLHSPPGYAVLIRRSSITQASQINTKQHEDQRWGCILFDRDPQSRINHYFSNTAPAVVRQYRPHRIAVGLPKLARVIGPPLHRNMDSKLLVGKVRKSRPDPGGMLMVEIRFYGDNKKP